MSKAEECRGSCLCGAVSLTVNISDHQVGVCHCSICRRWGGGPFFAVEAGRQVQIEGEENITTYASSDWAKRGFCRHCGTHLFYRLNDEDAYVLPVSLIDSGQPWDLALEIFTDEKPVFYDFSNATRQMTGREVFEAGNGKSS